MGPTKPTEPQGDSTSANLPPPEPPTFAQINEHLKLQIENEKLAQELAQLKLNNETPKTDWSREAKGYSTFSEIRKIVYLSFFGEHDNLQAFIE